MTTSAKQSTKAIRLFGIPNCDTVKKARNWLDSREINYDFRDLRAGDLNAAQVKAWIESVGLEQLLNKRSTTWKNLDAAQRESLNEKTAVTLILENPTLIKRPLLEIEAKNGKLLRKTGFKTEDYLALF